MYSRNTNKFGMMWLQPHHHTPTDFNCLSTLFL